MHRDVQDHAAAGLWLVQAPALKVRRQVDGMEHARKQRLANGAGLNQLPHLAVRGRVAQVVVGRHHHAGLVAGLDHGNGVLGAQCQRLFAQHVLARSGSGNHLVAVQLIGGADVDRLHLGVGQERVHRAVGGGDVAGLGKALSTRLAAAGNSLHKLTRLRPNRADHVLACYGAGAYETPTRVRFLVHVRFCLRLLERCNE